MSIVDTVKDLVSLVQKADNIDLTNKVLDLQNQLLELVQGRWELQREAERLRRRVEELENEKALRDELTFAHNAYWRGEPGPTGEGPYCARCWDQTSTLARVLHNGDNYSHCPACRTVIELPWHASLRAEFKIAKAHA